MFCFFFLICTCLLCLVSIMLSLIFSKRNKTYWTTKVNVYLFQSIFRTCWLLMVPPSFSLYMKGSSPTPKLPVVLGCSLGTSSLWDIPDMRWWGILYIRDYQDFCWPFSKWMSMGPTLSFSFDKGIRTQFVKSDKIMWSSNHISIKP